jgi:sterol desaturase/sphingolipid hydroxylase (fatty acid hydroxylase superfamily)
MPALRFLVRYAYAPLFLVGFIAAALAIVAGGGSKLVLLPLLLVAIGVAFLAERILPYELAWNEARGDAGRDWLHAVVNEVSIFASIAAIPLLAAVVPRLGIWPTGWPLWAQLVVAILVVDLGITLAHWASHKLGWLWRFHAVHHSVGRMYGFNGLMKHPIHQAIELTAGTAPLLLAGMTVEAGALLAFAVAIQLLLQHSNADYRVGPFVYLWAVAPGHRHHHLASKTDGDVNFGLFTMLWDHALGTFEVARPQPLDGEIGVARRPDYPVRYGAQLIEPFRRQDRHLVEPSG